MDQLIREVFSQSQSLKIDLLARQELLRSNLDRIFAKSGFVDLWEHDQSANTLQECKFSDLETFKTDHMRKVSGYAELGQFIFVCFPSPPSKRTALNTTHSFISQNHSWSKPQVSAEQMLQILTHHRIGPALLDFVHCFGTKVTGQDNAYYGTFWAKFSDPGTEVAGSHYEFCYHLRRYEVHGNHEMKDPWSLRQMTIYQRYGFGTQKSIWIFIKPFQHCQDKLRALILDKCHSHPMALHTLIITMAVENWRWYIDFLRKSLGEFKTEKAVFSSFDSTTINYDIRFVDHQRLFALESKITVAVAVLGQSIAIATGMKGHCRRMAHVSIPGVTTNMKAMVEDDIEMQIAQLELHKASCELILHQLNGTCTLISKIIDSRNDLVIKEYNSAVTALARISNAQNESLNLIARKTRQDSRMMKVLTVIAMAYVPASLIASIFSSDLIVTSQETRLSGSFHVSKDMWIFVLSSVTVTSITMSLAFYWTRHQD